MKIAIISDIHGNMQALDAVLTDIERENCEKIFCLGDLAMAGPQPIETIIKIKSLYDVEKLDLIQGNTDELIVYSEKTIPLVKEKFPIMGNALENDAQIIPEDLKEFLNSLDKQKEFEVEGVKVLLVHGSPRKNDENIFPDLPIEQIEEMVTGTSADVIFCGHTHMPCGYQTSTKQTVVNVGSIGRPFTQDPQSCYVIAEINDGDVTISHKLIKYDKDKAAEILANRDFEGADKLSSVLINPEKRHM